MGLKENASNFFFRRAKEKPRFVPNAAEMSYFRDLSEMYDIKSIYYPAAGTDAETFDGLGNEFQIVTLDNESWWENNRAKDMHNYMVGDFTESLFKDEVFDAVFIQDIDSYKLADIFRTLKRGGILVVSAVPCIDDIKPWEYEKIENLERIVGPKTNLRYHTFRKVDSISQEQIYNNLGLSNITNL